MHSNSNDGLPLLHIDDSADDRFFIKQAILRTQTAFTLYQAESLEASTPYFQFYKHNGGPRQCACPALVLLDYDVGTQKGTDFLVWLRLVKRITSIPVVMLSGSVSQPHIEECYANGANCFLSKPKDLTAMETIVRSLYLSLTIPNGPNHLLLLPEYQVRLRESSLA